MFDYTTATAREVFDFVKAALIKQGVPSRNEYAQCVYRGPNGTKCAAGHVLPNKVYSDILEGRDWSWVVRVLEEKYPNKDWNNHRALIMRLQSAHDGASADAFAAGNPASVWVPEVYMKRLLSKLDEIERQLL